MIGLGQRRGQKIARDNKSLFIIASITAITLLVAFYYSNAGYDYSTHLNNLNLLYSDYNKSMTKSKANSSSYVDKNPIKIAYAISLIKCGNFESTSAGLVDASIVLRHSVHLTSVRNPASGSKYDYKMYAIVHKDAEQCSSLLEDAGFTVLIRDVPVKKEEIQNEYLRKSIHKEWCCGHDEFIKLYAYTLPEPIVVHVDIDYIFHKPMDTLFDAMLYDANHEKNIAARLQIPVERPYNNLDEWPNRIDAFMTRDWPQVLPGRKAAYQAGLLVVRPSTDVFKTILNVIRTTNYVEGFGRDNGWGGLGYGAFVGAMAMQGLLAYVYDEIIPNNWVELNQCRYNHMGMDIKVRNKCRNNKPYCEDCMHTNITDIYNIHYTRCRKPWNCIGEGSSQGGNRKEVIPEAEVHLDHCMELMTVWHNVRSDLENKMIKLTNDETVGDGRLGSYKPNVFQGHCASNGGKGYINLSGKPETFKRLPELYPEL